MGPRKMRHRSSMIVTSIAAPKASTATLGKSQVFPGFSSILQVWANAHQRISIYCQKKENSYYEDSLGILVSNRSYKGLIVSHFHFHPLLIFSRQKISKDIFSNTGYLSSR